MSRIEETYRAATPKSARCAERAEAVMPGGDTRSTTYHRPYPLAIARGEGPFLWDVDGNRYIDLLGNYTSLVHGNAYPPICEAIAAASRNGTAWPARSEAQTELAELICERVASVERVRFCNSGTEAGMLAAQVARRITGRKLILMARYGYHGSYDDFEVGLAGHDGERTLLADYGDANAFEQILAARGNRDRRGLSGTRDGLGGNRHSARRIPAKRGRRGPARGRAVRDRRGDYAQARDRRRAITRRRAPGSHDDGQDNRRRTAGRSARRERGRDGGVRSARSHAAVARGHLQRKPAHMQRRRGLDTRADGRTESPRWSGWPGASQPRWGARQQRPGCPSRRARPARCSTSSL